MKRKEKIRWLREVAKRLRAAAGAPGVLLVMVWLGNGALLLMGKPLAAPQPEPDKMGALGVVAVALSYIGFSAVATKLELQADQLEEETHPTIVVETPYNVRRKGDDST